MVWLHLYELYQNASTPWRARGAFQKSKINGLKIFSSPFDPTAVDFEKLQVPAYKIYRLSWWIRL